MTEHPRPRLVATDLVDGVQGARVLGTGDPEPAGRPAAVAGEVRA